MNSLARLLKRAARPTSEADSRLEAPGRFRRMFGERTSWAQWRRLRCGGGFCWVNKSSGSPGQARALSLFLSFVAR